MAWNETTRTIICDQSGVDHFLTVATPIRYEALDAAPLILCLDGAWIAGTVRDATRIMSMSGEAPEAIVASLSFTDETMRAYNRSRAIWYCPTPWVPPEIVGVKDVVADDVGKALIYLAFIREQVLPMLRAELRVSESWLVGHSFSALFGLRALFTDPTLFDKYVLASPSIWWDGRVMFDIEAVYAADHNDLAARVFMTAGAEEDALGDMFNMGDNMVEMAERLASRDYPSLSIAHAILPAESHSSTIGAAVSRGLRHLR